MSVASSSIPHVKIPNSSSLSSSSTFRFSATRPTIVTIRNSQTDGSPRKPVAPSAPTIRSPTPPSPLPPKRAVLVEEKSVITMEFQRQQAKELQEYFKQKKIEEANQGPFIGFIGKNEIANGRRHRRVQSLKLQQGSSSTSTSSSIKHAIQEGTPLPSLSPNESSQKSMSPNSEVHPNATNNIKSLPPLPNAKTRITKYNGDGDDRYTFSKSRGPRPPESWIRENSLNYTQWMIRPRERTAAP